MAMLCTCVNLALRLFKFGYVLVLCCYSVGLLWLCYLPGVILCACALVLIVCILTSVVNFSTAKNLLQKMSSVGCYQRIIFWQERQRDTASCRKLCP